MTERSVRALCLPLLCLAAACGKDTLANPCKGGVLVDVGGAFAKGTVLRDGYAGCAVAVDGAGKVNVQPGPSGVALLEKEGSAPMPFDWRNALVYFALTDRFANGDPANDHSYGTRPADGQQEVGTWHGGDWKGLTGKLDYLKSLGVSAIWISPIVEQVHGWAAGGDKGEFKHYGYAGYWALDFTRLDANWGSEDDLHALVDGAHALGIRVLVDVVLNHPGYATGDDLVAYLPEVFNDGTGQRFKSFTPDFNASTNPGWYGWNNLVDYQSANWGKWWSPKWIRAGLGASGQFDPGGSTDQTRQLAYLPDFKTEATTPADKPVLFERKRDTAFVARPNATVRDYLVEWHSSWVRKFGFDGFRCDTALNVETGSWAALKVAASAALAGWKAANPTKKIDDAPFWMTGEVYGHDVSKDDYFTQGGFDSLINFAFQGRMKQSLAYSGDLVAATTEVERLYSGMANALTGDPGLQVLSYLSSHDTGLIYADLKYDTKKQMQAGAALLLAPGAVQLFYGDESGRRLGPAATDPTQGTRSDMNWSSIDQDLLAHFKKLSAFRQRHAAVGQGAHQKLASPAGSYAFSRRLDAGSTHDAVVVVLVPPA